MIRRKRAAAERKRRMKLRKRYAQMTARAKRREQQAALFWKNGIQPKGKFFAKKRIRRWYGKKIYPSKCDLTIEVFPLYYMTVTRNSAFKLAFMSNCLPRIEINFEVYYFKNYQINFYQNPKNVFLNLWGNKYLLKYYRPLVIDKYDIMKSIEYQRAVMKKLTMGRSKRVTTVNRNVIMLNPKKRNTFNSYTLKKIDDLDGVCDCKLKKVMFRGWKILKKMHDARKKRKKKLMAEMNRQIDLARDAMRAQMAKKHAKKGRRLKGVKKKSQGRVIPKDTGDLGKIHKLPHKYHSKKAQVRRVMARKYIVDFAINCDIL